MEDNSSGEEEIQDSCSSPKPGSKKIKLNDGSSQDSIKDTASCSKDENADSGVSADKSESTSSDDRTAGGSEGPSNQMVIAAPSTSNVRAILLNFRRPKRGQNYRKRKTPGRDSDSNNTSTDSDDVSIEETAIPVRQKDNSNSETESDDLQRFIDLYDSSNNSRSISERSSGTSNSYDSDQMIQLQSSEAESDEVELSSRNSEAADDNDTNNENKGKPHRVLLKIRPEHNYLILREIINRELGAALSSGETLTSHTRFERNFYGSLHAIYRMKKLHHLNKHRGCVNSIHFHPEGHLLASGSDDMSVVVWDWARKQALQTIKTGHKSNVFQSKFMYLNAQSQLNIVTCARDGQVRLVQCPASGGCGASRRRLACHSRAAHKLHVCSAEPHTVLSAGEDGLVMQCDVRAEHANKLFQVKEKNMTIPLYSVHGHPLDPKQLVVAGRDKFVRVYDRRKSNKVVAMYCPTILLENTSSSEKKLRLSTMHLTCAVYNHDGTEILGSYNDEDIYLFDAKNDVHDKDNTNELKDGYTYRYGGHRNSATFKGVAFFGPKSEYIVSGSDCSYIYIWDKKTESIVQWMKGDANGVVNCIEPHPRCPVLATSGLDKDVKIWMPRGDTDPTYEGLERVVRDNTISQLRSPLFDDFLPSLYSAWRSENRRLDNILGNEENSLRYGGNIEFDGNVCTTF